MASSLHLLLPRAPPRLPPLLTCTTRRPLLSSSSSSPFPFRLQALLSLPKAIATTCSTCNSTFLPPLASQIVPCPTVHIAGPDPRQSWKASFSGRTPPPLPPSLCSEPEELPPRSTSVPAPALPFSGGDLLRGAWPGFWLQLWIAVLSRALLWAIHRPCAPGFPRPAVATWVLLGLWRAISPDATLGLVPLDRLVAGATGKPDLGPVACSAAAAALLSLAVGCFLAMDRLAARAVSEVARRHLISEAAIVAFFVWSVWVLTGAGEGGGGADGGRGGGRAARWWELAMCAAWVHLLVLCLCLPHNLVTYVLVVVDQMRNAR